MGLFRWIVEKVKNFFGIGNSHSYSPSTSSVDETERLGRALTDFTDSLNDQGKSLEKQAKKLVSDFFDKFISELDQMQIYKSVIQGLNMQKSSALASIDGVFINPIKNSANLSNPECLRILKMNAGDEKKTALNQFAKQIINEGINALCATLDTTTNEICQIVHEDIGDLLETRKNSVEKLNEGYSALIESHNSNFAKADAFTYQAAIKVLILELSEKQLEEGM